MERQAFLCPLCNAPHNEELQPGTLQVRCKYCGGVILVPSRLSGLYVACPDHPESQSVGLCTNCGRNCCEQCLHVFEGASDATRYYLCPQCASTVVPYAHPQAYDCLIVFSLVLLAFGIALWAFGPGAGNVRLTEFLIMSGALFLVAGLAAKYNPPKPPLTLREKRQEREQELRDRPGFTWAQCPHCSAGYFYGPGRIGSGHEVTCQNCDRRFSLAE